MQKISKSVNEMWPKNLKSVCEFWIQANRKNFKVLITVTSNQCNVNLQPILKKFAKWFNKHSM